MTRIENVFLHLILWTLNENGYQIDRRLEQNDPRIRTEREGSSIHPLDPALAAGLPSTDFREPRRCGTIRQHDSTAQAGPTKITLSDTRSIEDAIEFSKVFRISFH
ncbi:hypothetical protein ACYQOP_16505 [Methylobacterium sp. CM6247]